MSKEIKSAIVAGIILSFITLVMSLVVDLLIKNGEIQLLEFESEGKSKIIFVVENWSRKFDNKFEIRIPNVDLLEVVDKNQIYNLIVRSDGYDGSIISFNTTDYGPSGIIVLSSNKKINSDKISVISSPFGYNLIIGSNFSYYTMLFDNIVRVIFVGTLFSLFTYYIERKLNTSITKSDELSKKLDSIYEKHDKEKKDINNRVNSVKLYLYKRLKESELETNMWRRVVSRVMATTFNDRSHGREIVKSFIMVSGGSVNWNRDIEDLEYNEIIEMLDMLRQEKSKSST